VMKSGTAPWSWVSRKLAQTWTDNITRRGRLEQSLEEASFDAWIRYYKPTEFSTNSTVSYYEKGSLIAWLMDAKIRLASGGRQGVDDYFRLLWSRFGDGSITDEDLRDACRTLCGEDPEPFWKDYIRGVRELDSSPIEQAYGLKLAGLLPREVLSPEGQGDAEAVKRAVVFTGLSFQGDAPTVLNVVPGSPAAEAGLAYGQEILAVNGWRTATASEITRRIGDRQVGESVEVLATDRGQVRRRTFILAENLQKTTRILPVAKPSPVQREAFEDWTGQTFPAGKGRR